VNRATGRLYPPQACPKAIPENSIYCFQNFGHLGGGPGRRTVPSETQWWSPI